MGWVLLAMAGLWGLGAWMRMPVRLRLAMVALIYLAVLLALAVLPAGSGLREGLGVSLGGWALIGVLAAAVALYAGAIAALRARARPARPQDEKGDKVASFQSTELERYARHIMLREIGGPGQKKLKQARVLVVGAGGLGAPVLQYLTAAGVGTIGVIDDDVVDNSNLQRQVIHKDAAIGMPKVFSAQHEMEAQNPAVTVRPYNRRLSDDIAAELFADYDLVLDGSDNFATRYLVNRTCVALKKPLIAAAITQWEGQISTYDPASGAPCYQCIFPQAPAPGLAPSCAEAGVAGPLPGVLGAMMALEAVKEITGAGEGLRGRMLIYDGLWGESRSMTLRPDPTCETCGQVAPAQDQP